MTRATSEPADRLGRANVCLKCPVHSKASGQTGVAGVGGVGGGGRFLRRHHHQTLAWAFRPPGLKCRRLHLLAVKPRTSYLTSLGLRFAVCKVGRSQHPPHRLSRGSRHRPPRERYGGSGGVLPCGKRSVATVTATRTAHCPRRGGGPGGSHPCGVARHPGLAGVCTGGREGEGGSACPCEHGRTSGSRSGRCGARHAHACTCGIARAVLVGRRGER